MFVYKRDPTPSIHHGDLTASTNVPAAEHCLCAASTMPVRLRSCCLCLSPRTGSAVLGALGVVTFVGLMVPEVLLLQDHRRYLSEFVRDQREQGGEAPHRGCN